MKSDSVLFGTLALAAVVFAGCHRSGVRPESPSVAPVASIEPSSPTEEAANRVFRIDFSGDGDSRQNLYVADGRGSFWQVDDPHKMVVLIPGREPWTIDSYSTLIAYEAGKFAWMRLYISPAPPVPYRQALARARAFVEKAGAPLQIDWNKYDAALDHIPISSETFIPEARFGEIRLQLMLNCNWETAGTARTQLDSATCHPHLEFEPVTSPYTGSSSP